MNELFDNVEARLQALENRADLVDGAVLGIDAPAGGGGKFLPGDGVMAAAPMPFDVASYSTDTTDYRMYIPEDFSTLVHMLGESVGVGVPYGVAGALWSGDGSGWVKLGELSNVTISVAVGKSSEDPSSAYVFCIVKDAPAEFENDIAYYPVAQVTSTGIQQLFHGAIEITGHFGDIKSESGDEKREFTVDPLNRASTARRIKDICTNLKVVLEGEVLVITYDSGEMLVDTHGVIREWTTEEMEIRLDLSEMC